MNDLTPVKLAELQPHPDNYNTHPEAQLVELAKSLDRFQQFKNIVVSRGVILAGHGIVEAAKRKGVEELDALVLDDLTEAQQKALLIADIETPTLSIPDAGNLQDLLNGMDSLDVPGVDDAWLSQFDLTPAPDALFTPNTEPGTAHKTTTPEDIAQAERRLAEKHQNPQNLVEVHCAHCGATFYIAP